MFRHELAISWVTMHTNPNRQSWTPASTATAWTSSDRHLLQLAFEVHEPRGSAYGLIHQEGCEGASIKPIGQSP
jgi:hypothetical protein